MFKRMAIYGLLLFAAGFTAAQDRPGSQAPIYSGPNAKVCFEPKQNSGADVCLQRTGVGVISLTNGVSNTGTPVGGRVSLVNSNVTVDVFNRASIGANYTNYLNSVVSTTNAARGTNGPQLNVATWNASPVSTVQACRVLIASLNATVESPGCAVGISGTINGPVNYYTCNENTTTLQLQKVVGATNGSFGTVTGPTAAITGVVGDTLWLVRVGNTITCYRNGYGRTLQISDSISPMAAGQAGLAFYGASATVSSLTVWSGAPPASADMNIICDGDSIINGELIPVWPCSSLQVTNANNPYAFSTGVTSKGMGVTILSLNSGFIESMITSGPAIDSLYTPGIKNVVVILGCSNDISLSSRTPAQCYADLQTYTANRHTAGWKVVAVPVPSRSTFDLGMQEFNRLLQAGGTGGGTTLPDAIAILPQAIVGSAQYTNTLLFLDQIHLTQLGYTMVLAPAISSAINSLNF